MDNVTLLLLQRLKSGEDAEFKDEKETEGIMVVTDDRLVVYAKANSAEDLPERLKTDQELGPSLEFFKKLDWSMDVPQGDLASALEIDDTLFKGTYERGPNKRVVVKTDHKYVVKGIKRLTGEEYENRAAILRHGQRRLDSILHTEPIKQEAKRVEVEVIEPKPIPKKPRESEGTYQKPAENTGLLQKLKGLYRRAVKPVVIGALALAAVATPIIAYKAQKDRERYLLEEISPDEESKLMLDLKSKIAPLLSDSKNYRFKDGNYDYDLSVGKHGVKVIVYHKPDGVIIKDITKFAIDTNGKISNDPGYAFDSAYRGMYRRAGTIVDMVLKQKGE